MSYLGVRVCHLGAGIGAARRLGVGTHAILFIFGPCTGTALILGGGTSATLVLRLTLALPLSSWQALELLIALGLAPVSPLFSGPTLVLSLSSGAGTGVTFVLGASTGSVSGWGQCLFNAV